MRRDRWLPRVGRLAQAWWLVLPLLAGCDDEAPSAPGSDLSHLARTRISVQGIEFEVWVADTPIDRERGLQFARADQLAPLPDGTPRGMLFVFPAELFLNFWMKDTFIPLDLAYIRDGGTISEIHAMRPHDETIVMSQEPVRYGLEVRAGLFAALGIGPGDVAVIPPPFSD